MPICSAMRMISTLSMHAQGRSTGVVVTALMHTMDSSVWLATCPTLSPVAMAWQCRFSASPAAMRSIIRRMIVMA